MVKKLFLLFLMVFALSFAFACNEDKKDDDDKQNEETKEFTVTFVANGEKSEVKVAEGEKASKPADPEKEGYTFLGWYVGDDAYDFEKAVTSDLEVVAKFEEKADEPEVKEFTVTFVVDGEKTEVKVKEGEKAVKPIDPVKEGFVFLGWYVGDDEYAFDAVTADVTVTAKFEEVKPEVKEYTVKFVVDGEASEVKVVEGEKASKPADPEKVGYVFLGWYVGEEAYDFETLVTSDLEVVAKFEEEVKEIVPVAIEFVETPETMYLDDVVTLQVKVLPEGAPQEVTWKCINKTKASIDENGLITPLRSGDTKFQAICATDTSIKAEITINIKSYINPDKFFGQMGFEQPVVKNFTAYGYEANWNGTLLSSVTKYMFEDFSINENWMPENHPDRPGTIMTPKYVTVHDVGATSASSNGKGTSNYCNQVTESSWHFSVGNDGAWQNLPMNEVAWHAGDGTHTPLTFTDTGVKATGTDAAKVTISSDGYFEMNGEKTKIKAPTKSNGNIVRTSELPYTGINNYVDSKTGTYWIGNTWWSNTYQTLSNRGGNLNSVGIETSVSKGSNVFYTWNITAKLIGTVILPQNGLQPKDVKQHNTFSGKDCPMTMRHANMWETFIELVEAEYTISRYFRNWNIELISDSPYIDSRGLLVTLPDTEQTVSYQVKVTSTSEGYEKVFDFSFKLPGKAGYTVK